MAVSAFMPRNVGGSWVPQVWDTPDPAAVAAAYANGTTVDMPDTADNGFVFVDNLALIMSLSVNLPSDAKSVIGQIRRIYTRNPITAITVNQIGGGATIVGTVSGMAVGGALTFQKIAPNTWARAS